MHPDVKVIGLAAKGWSLSKQSAQLKKRSMRQTSQEGIPGKFRSRRFHAVMQYSDRLKIASPHVTAGSGSFPWQYSFLWNLWCLTYSNKPLNFVQWCQERYQNTFLYHFCVMYAVYETLSIQLKGLSAKYPLDEGKICKQYLILVFSNGIHLDPLLKSTSLTEMNTMLHSTDQRNDTYSTQSACCSLQWGWRGEDSIAQRHRTWCSNHQAVAEEASSKTKFPYTREHKPWAKKKT